MATTILMLAGVAVIATSGCQGRTVVSAADAGADRGAGPGGDSAAPGSDIYIPAEVPVSGIRFQDVHLTTGNPRKVNPNTPQATEPDNLVRLYVEPVVASPPPLTYRWSVSAGRIVEHRGREIRFSSSAEGQVRVSCRITNRSTGQWLDRSLAIQIRQGVQAFPLIRGDYAVWTLLPDELIQAVHLPTRKLLTLGPGQADDFDGVRVISKSPRFGDHAMFIYDIASGKKTTISTPTMKAAWDHRFFRIRGQRIYWANTNTYYTLLPLYTMRIGDSAEQKVHGSELVIHTVLDESGKLKFTTKALSAYKIFNYSHDPANNKVTPLRDLDPQGMVVSWYSPWIVLRDLSTFRLLNLKTREQRKVSTSYSSLVNVLVSGTHHGGHARDAFGSKGEVFLVSLDGTSEKRVPLDHNNFTMPAIDGSRLVYAHDNDIYLLSDK